MPRKPLTYLLLLALCPLAGCGGSKSDPLPPSAEPQGEIGEPWCEQNGPEGPEVVECFFPPVAPG